MGNPTRRIHGTSRYPDISAGSLSGSATRRARHRKKTKPPNVVNVGWLFLVVSQIHAKRAAGERRPTARLTFLFLTSGLLFGTLLLGGLPFLLLGTLLFLGYLLFLLGSLLLFLSGFLPLGRCLLLFGSFSLLLGHNTSSIKKYEISHLAAIQNG